MPEDLKASEVNSETDPSVAKQYDRDTPIHEQFDDLYAIVDDKKIGLLNTYRNGTGPVGRSMALAKRVGPDFLFLANAHSNKFSDLQDNKEVQLTFQDSKTQDWVSVSGMATTASNEDPRIKEIYSKAVSAWFGDLGDGVYNGTPEDPRMSLIEVKSKYISYWKHTVSSLGFMKEVGVATLTGKVAETGVSRELKEEDIEKARSMAD
jgi:general stress protein 26